MTSAEKAALQASLDRHREWIPWDPDDSDGDARVKPDETTADILAYYARARAAADSVIAEYDLDHEAHPPDGLWGEPVTLRWILLNVLEDTARHAGHADILRELIDGTTGFRR